MVARFRLAEVLGGLSMVADLGFGLPRGTAVRTSLIATALARRLDLGAAEARDAYYTALLIHVGCVAVAHESAAAFGDDLALNRAVSRSNLADPEDVRTTLLPELTRRMSAGEAERVGAFALSADAMAWGRRTDTGVCEVAREVAHRLGLPASTQDALYHAFESWVGGAAPDGLRGEDIPLASRVARAALETAVFSQLGGVATAVDALRARAGVILDPGVVEVLVDDAASFVAEADRGDPSEWLLEVEPTPAIERDGRGIVDVARAFGDLADLKVPWMHGHARAVARLAVGGARRLGMDPSEAEHLEIAALLHDVGRVGVSNAIWEKAGPLTRLEWEQARMHAYHSERILAASPSLAPYSSTAGMHHERLDGSGYHRGTTAPNLTRAVRVLAAADVYVALVSPRPHRRALDRAAAADALAGEVRSGRLDPDAAHAVLSEAGHPMVPQRGPRPAGLSDREVEVLVLIARGHTNAEVADALFISKRTAEHHAQHIYAKIGLSTRAGAAMFAVQHGLVEVNG
jgi:HD-GYP domain-containing protein (c-di-GMP phosphodiesterase class II)/DNA-binding CsgD family transcriptional regulator